ncbi:hypothetical protein E4U57_006172 [Claviceps arundinis]|uniref:Pentatricopeptide repeat domain-containing protein n=2 Tax=Claviceps arundinis TaxID=1623583 RepID=A0ABQ7P2B6_9HYPO|nr:hypothetical protein E4U57_006172 [Claviceps arundinis]
MRIPQMINRGDAGKGIWEIFELLQKDETSGNLSRDEAQLLRDEVLAVTMTSNSWLNILVDTAHRLLAKYDFYWPDLYMKVMHHMLETRRHDDTIIWHLRLAPKFLPSTDTFGAILSNFVLDPSPSMQSTLTALYISSKDKGLYDHLIPVLFAAGCSKLARLWRKKLLVFGDFPKSNLSTPFLRFLHQYYPSIALTNEEKLLAEVADSFIEDAPLQSKLSNDLCFSKGQYSDSIVAKWLASSWTSIDFAIHLAQRLGLRVMGPRSLQSLALRESGARMTALRLARIEQLGITVSNKNYCKVLAFFAKCEEDSLLADLLACDIHPDEFDDVETRRMLKVSALRNRDWRRQRLLQGIEWAIDSEPSSHRLNAILQQELETYKLGRVRQILDRMEALNINMNRESASQLLEVAFRGLGKHSAKRKRKYRSSKSRTSFQRLLNMAIGIVRRVALHDVAIPLRYWKLLLWNLGRSGRLDEFQQLSEEIVQLYSPSSGGLLPICCEDLPGSLLKSRAAIKASRASSTLSPYAKDTENGSGRDAISSSSPTLSNYGNVKADWNCSRCDQANRGAKACSTPHLTAPNHSSRHRSPRTKACGNWNYPIPSIPSDLPFSHEQHPIQQIFDLDLQRSIVRWGFDQKLTTSSASPSLEDLAGTGLAICDITKGVRLLARLKYLGVIVDLQVLRAVILSKIALAQIPGSERNRSRDKLELSPECLKLLFDEAWGSDIFPSALDLRGELDKQKPKLWSRYAKLFEQSFDQPQNSSQEDMLFL